MAYENYYWRPERQPYGDAGNRDRSGTRRALWNARWERRGPGDEFPEYAAEPHPEPPRGVDYEFNWGDEARDDYGRRDYYGNRETGDRYGRGGYAVADYGEPPSGFGREADMADFRRTEQAYGARQHRGRGPRGYTRSNERIHEDVCELLTDDPRIDASNLEVRVTDGEVTLTGTVGSRSEKRLAEDLADRVRGVKDVHNQLRIAVGEPEGPRPASPSARH